MKMYKLGVVVALALFLTTYTVRAASVVGATFNMSGKLTGSFTADCKKSGSYNFPNRLLRKGLHGSIKFNQSNAFLWSGDGLAPTPLTGVTGFWGRKGNLIDLEFDDASVSGLRSIKDLLPMWITQQGIILTIRMTKYDFFAKTNASANQLAVTESASFKINGRGTIQGVTDSCIVRAKLQRIYKGRSVL